MDSCLKGKAQSLIQFLLGSHTSSRCEEDPAIQPCYTPVEKPLGLLPSSFLLYYWQSQKSRVILFGLRTHPFLSFCPVLLSSPNCALCPLTQCTNSYWKLLCFQTSLNTPCPLLLRFPSKHWHGL